MEVDATPHTGAFKQSIIKLRYARLKAAAPAMIDHQHYAFRQLVWDVSHAD
jgi:hypothetical protein